MMKKIKIHRQITLNNNRMLSRWFHDGCCECVGSTCINYGINESRCTACPETKDDDLEDMPDEDELDFGEGNGPLDVDTNI